MQKSYKLQILSLVLFLLFIISSDKLTLAKENNIAKKLSGKILLQVESLGEAWYLNPGDNKRYYLGRPIDAFNLMRDLGIGITNIDLDKIPIGVINYNDIDNDNDGLTNRFETALGTDPNNPDSDNDGYSDLEEIINYYNLVGTGKQLIDIKFTEKNLGKIFLQIEKNGEAWYVNPDDNKRYFLGKPADAFDVMKNIGLGISNNNLDTIDIAYSQIEKLPNKIPNQNLPTQTTSITANDAIIGAANAIRVRNSTLIENYFVPEMKNIVLYNINNMSDESLFDLAAILYGAKLISSTENEKIYSTEVLFSLGGQYIQLDFIVKKQEDGTWLMSNL